MRLARNGHLSELTMERIAAGEPTQDEVATHLETCSVCRESIARIQADDVVVPPFRPLTPDAPSPRRFWLVAPPVLTGIGVLVALVILWPTPPPVDDGIRIKGNAFSMTLYANNERAIRPLHTGADVQPRERIGFRVATREAGYFAILGMDEKGSSYVCYPQKGHDAAEIKPGPEFTLDEAVRLDEVRGTEHVVSIFCDQPFQVTDALRRLRFGSDGKSVSTVYTQCEQREVTLVKQ